MESDTPDLDAAWEQVVAARAKGNKSAEASALRLLAQALHHEGRSAEARVVSADAADLGMRRGMHYVADARKVDWYFSAYGRDPNPNRSAPMLSGGGLQVTELVIVGYLAVNALGPFLQAWATKLGELAGESTARMLGRIHLKKIRYSSSGFGGGELPEGRIELTASPPNTFPIVLVMPRHLSDAAILALIDLDPAKLGPSHKHPLAGHNPMTLYWCKDAGRWLTDWYGGAPCCTTCQRPECSPALPPPPRSTGFGRRDEDEDRFRRVQGPHRDDFWGGR